MFCTFWHKVLKNTCCKQGNKWIELCLHESCFGKERKHALFLSLFFFFRQLISICFPFPFFIYYLKLHPNLWKMSKEWFIDGCVLKILDVKQSNGWLLIKSFKILDIHNIVFGIVDTRVFKNTSCKQYTN